MTTDEHLDRIARLASEDNWRMVSMESEDQTDYDAMAWSPLDCEIGEDGRMSDPLFHKPWKLAGEALAAIRERILALESTLRQIADATSEPGIAARVRAVLPAEVQP